MAARSKRDLIVLAWSRGAFATLATTLKRQLITARAASLRNVHWRFLRRARFRMSQIILSSLATFFYLGPDLGKSILPCLPKLALSMRIWGCAASY